MKTIWNQQQRGFALMEYVGLIVIVLMASLVFASYMKRGFQGQIKKSGQSFAFGRQYDPHGTIDCAFDQEINAWYSTACFDHEFATRECNLRRSDEVCDENGVCVVPFLDCQQQAKNSCKAVCVNQ